MRTALVRAPSPRLHEGLVTHIDRQPVDVDAANQQWHGYVETMRNEGWTIFDVAPADDCPDSVFIEDAVVMFGDVAVLCRPGADSRRAEVAGARAAVAALGFSPVEITAPGTLDGGDVLKVGSVAYVGLGGRTNAEGIAQLDRLLGPRGWKVVAVPTTKVLHLKSAVTALPDGRVIGYEPVVDDPRVFGEFVAMPEEPGAHVVLLGDESDRLLLSADAPRSAELLVTMGYQPVPVDIGEFEKLEGCVTCLSVRVRAQPT